MLDSALQDPRRTPSNEATLAFADGPARYASAVSWPAVIAGATAAAALSLILLVLGTGLGLSAVSPWAGQGASAGAMGVSTIVWLAFTQIAAAGMGGYLAGRLRARWATTPTDEVYFRDTAHGFLAWALATLVTAATLTSAIGAILGNGVQAGATLAGSATSLAMPAMNDAARPDASGPSSSQAYFVDALLRKDIGATPVASSASAADDAAMSGMASPSMPGAADEMSRAAVTREAGRILASAMSDGALAPEDSKYLGQLVARHTGLTPAEADKRVTDTFARLQAKSKQVQTAAREAADQAKKAAAHAALWLFVSLLAGAFCASLAAVFGGRQRDGD